MDENHLLAKRKALVHEACRKIQTAPPGTHLRLYGAAQDRRPAAEMSEVGSDFWPLVTHQS